MMENRPDVAPSQDSAVEVPRRVRGRKLMGQGLIWFAGGVIVTMVTYWLAASSPYGSYYFVTYGAIIFGIVQFVRGWSVARGTETNEQAQEFLDAAAHLESVDRARAVALYAEIARNFPGTRESDEAQRNIQTLTSHKE